MQQGSGKENHYQLHPYIDDEGVVAPRRETPGDQAMDHTLLEVIVFIAAWIALGIAAVRFGADSRSVRDARSNW